MVANAAIIIRMMNNQLNCEFTGKNRKEQQNDRIQRTT